MADLPPINWHLKQKAVYWSFLENDTYGQPTWNAPVEIDVRWENITVEFMDSEGERQQSRARVYLDRNAEVKDVLLLGNLTSSVDEDDPKANDGAWEIRKFEDLPNIPATQALKTAFL